MRTRLSSNGFWFGAHGHGLERRALHLDDGHARCLLQRPDEGDRHLEHHLDLATRERRDLGRRLRHVHLPQLVQVGARLVPVVRELDHAGPLAGLELGHPERPRPRRLGRDLIGAVRGHDAAERHAHAHRQVAVGRRRVEADGVIVDRLDLLDRAHRGASRRCGLRIEDALEGEHDVARLELAPVMELDALPERERPHSAWSSELHAWRACGWGWSFSSTRARLSYTSCVIMYSSPWIVSAGSSVRGELAQAILSVPPGGASGPRPDSAARTASPPRARCPPPPAEGAADASDAGPSRRRVSVPSRFIADLLSPSLVGQRSITANASISTESSGSARPCTTTPVLQWWTPSKYFCDLTVHGGPERHVGHVHGQLAHVLDVPPASSISCLMFLHACSAWAPGSPGPDETTVQVEPRLAAEEDVVTARADRHRVDPVRGVLVGRGVELPDESFRHAGLPRVGRQRGWGGSRPE